MADTPAKFEPLSRMESLENMIRQQKHASAAAAKKAAAALRAQLHQELESKKNCAYQPHECSQLTLVGYDYCLRHIMEDKSAPYRQCSYVYNNNGKRCHLPAPKGDKKEHVYCSDHAFKCHLTRVRAAARHQPTNSVESMLDSLSHHVAPTTVKTTPLTAEDLDVEKAAAEAEALQQTKSLDPFSDIDPATINASRSRILDYGSESDSDIDAATYTNVWHDAQADSSDDESIDSEQEDVLKHAGIYTAEEVTLVTRDKLIRLQSLYIEQFKHLQHVLKERRRKYLTGLKREKDSLSSIHDQVKETPKEKRMYSKLKALNHYHKKHGIDAIMNKKFTELRAKLSEGGSSHRGPKWDKCIYADFGVKCGERSLPVTKYCRKHILHNRAQVLFKKCSKVFADTECHEPVLAVFGEPVCKYHMDYPPIRNYGETRTFDESDLEDSSSDHQPLDTLASSSCDSKIPAAITSSQLISFANQFPSASTSHVQDPMDNSTFKVEVDVDVEDALLDVEEASDEYVNVTNEVDVTSVDDNVNFGAFSGQEESNSSMNTMSKQEEDTTEMSAIDPDDDMAGIMMEMEKDAKLQEAE